MRVQKLAEIIRDGAYLLPFRRESPEVAWLYAQHLSYSLNGVAFEEFLVTKPTSSQNMSSVTRDAWGGAEHEARRIEQFIV